MFKRLIVLGSSAFLALAGLVPARAAVIDTFSFSNLSGWSEFGAEFSGRFTGTVEASGFIELSDLSAFHIIGTSNSLSNLTFFSYDTVVGASSLGFIDTISTLHGLHRRAFGAEPDMQSGWK